MAASLSSGWTGLMKAGFALRLDVFFLLLWCRPLGIVKAVEKVPPQTSVASQRLQLTAGADTEASAAQTSARRKDNCKSSKKCPRSVQANVTAISQNNDLLWSRQSDSNRRPADYKSAALPAELCRHLRGKISSDAPSASRFLYAFSIRLSLT